MVARQVVVQFYVVHTTAAVVGEVVAGSTADPLKNESFPRLFPKDVNKELLELTTVCALVRKVMVL